MFAWGHRLAVVATWVVVMAAAPVGAQGSVLVAPVQGSEAARVQHGERVLGAVRRALDSRGYRESVSQELLGQAVVACQTPECVEQALDAAGAAFAIVPAMWSRESGGDELTLTLVQRSGRNLNASGVVADDLSGTAVDLVDALLARRAATLPKEASGEGVGASRSSGASSSSCLEGGADHLDRGGRGCRHCGWSGRWDQKRHPTAQYGGSRRLVSDRGRGDRRRYCLVGRRREAPAEGRAHGRPGTRNRFPPNWH